VSERVSQPSDSRPVAFLIICRSKRNKIKLQPWLELRSHEELSFATELSLRAAAKVDASDIVKELSAALVKRAVVLLILRVI
jgi:hypothetical protein